MDRAHRTVKNAVSPKGEPMMRSRSSAGLRLAPVLGLVLGLAACGGPAPEGPSHPRTPGGAPVPSIVTSHGSALVTATPTNQTCSGGVHQKHLSQFACDTCHAPNGGVFGFTKTYTFPQGTTTAGGTITLASGTTPTTCTVACHYPRGQPARSITWDTPGPLACTSCHDPSSLPSAHPAESATASRSDCQTCHDTSSHTNGTVTLVGHATAWMDQTSTGFHAPQANNGIANCQGCHGQDLAGLGPAPSCASCHDLNLPVGVTSWKTNCTMCHGGTDNQTGAPPKATWGNGGDLVRIGAHSTHLRESAIAPTTACGACHVVPTDVLSQTHIDGGGIATLTFSGAAVNGIQGVATWSRDAATCANVYCHGATLGGGSISRPVWTKVDGTQAACGTCHGLPPPAPHPVVTGGLTTCYACHPGTMDSSGAIIPPKQGGKHLDGVVEAQAHPASWTDQTSSGFHAYSANQGLAQCEQCHGADLTGGIAGVSCASCHDLNLPVGVTSWKTNCTMCHGGTDNQTGAPPKATWGNGGDLVRVGAHTSHMSGSSIAPAFDCVVCHQKPVDAFAAGHIASGYAPVTFAGLATAGTTPTWDRPSASCASTYCHGGTLAGGSNVAPVWTKVDGTQAACGTCHGLPPPAPHPAYTGDLTGCAPCHSATMTAAGTVIPPASGGKHLDGVIEAVNGHASSWMDQTSSGFHAFAANRQIATCTGCHGADLSGGTTGVACAQCHDQNLPAGVTSWRTNCTMCHGGTDNQTGAPPRATWGNGGDPIRVGAHTAHVQGGSLRVGMGCVECHVKPTDALSPGHLVDSYATIAFGALASSSGAAPSWSRVSATCSSTYCHGGYSGTYTYFFYDAYYTASYAGSVGTPVWTDGPMACDSCHGNPPRLTGNWHSAVHGGGTDCQICHPDAYGVNGVGTAITDPTSHVNGTVDVVPVWKSSCFGCH